MKSTILAVAANVMAPFVSFATDGTWINTANTDTTVYQAWSSTENWKDGAVAGSGGGAWFTTKQQNAKNGLLIDLDTDVTLTNLYLNIVDQPTYTLQLKSVADKTMTFVSGANGMPQILNNEKTGQTRIYAKVVSSGDLGIETRTGFWHHNRLTVDGTLFINRGAVLPTFDNKTIATDAETAASQIDNLLMAKKVVIASSDRSQNRGELRPCMAVGSWTYNQHFDEIEVQNGLYATTEPVVHNAAILGASRTAGKLNLSIGKLRGTSSEFLLRNYSANCPVTISNTVSCLSTIRLDDNGTAGNTPYVVLPMVGDDDPLAGVKMDANATVETPSAGKTKKLGTLSSVGTFTLTKEGDGALGLPVETATDVTVDVKKGAVAFFADASAESILSGASVHLDASVADSVITNADDKVIGWCDLSGNGNNVTNLSLRYATAPAYVRQSQNGLSVVDYGDLLINGGGMNHAFGADLNETGMVFDQRTIVMVVRQNGQGAPIVARMSRSNPINNGNDYLNRSTASVQVWTKGNTDSRVMAGDHWFDGVRKTYQEEIFPVGSFHVIVLRTTEAVAFSSIAYYQGNRSGGIQLGELASFDRYLSDSEIRVLNTHLMKKWLNGVNPNSDAATGPLFFAANTALSLDVNATVRPVSLTAQGDLTIRIDGKNPKSGTYSLLSCDNMTLGGNVKFEYGADLLANGHSAKAEVTDDGIVLTLSRGLIMLLK